jgi:hypothetical protein
MRLFRRLSLRHLWIHGLRRMRDEYQETQDEIARGHPILRMSALVISGYFIVVIILGVYWSSSPAMLPVNTVIQRVLLEQHILPNEKDFNTAVPGIATTAALIAVVETLWQKPGGYIANDLLPPGIFLDDMPYWEFGVISQARDMTHMLRVSFSQAAINMIINNDLQKAEVRLNFSHKSWIFPASESQYDTGVEHLKKYLLQLAQPNNGEAYFYADAQHLNDYLASVEQRLKSLSQRLTASVGPNINTDDAAMPVTQTNVNGLYIKTPWRKLDDIFYEARGSSWALIALLQGLEIDFAKILNEKNAQASYEQIIRELEATQQTIYSPVVLNGDGFGFMVNHSLVMSSYISRTQAAIADCRRLLLKPSLPAATF